MVSALKLSEFLQQMHKLLQHDSKSKATYGIYPKTCGLVSENHNQTLWDIRCLRQNLLFFQTVIDMMHSELLKCHFYEINAISEV